MVKAKKADPNLKAPLGPLIVHGADHSKPDKWLSAFVWVCSVLVAALILCAVFKW